MSELRGVKVLRSEDRAMMSFMPIFVGMLLINAIPSFMLRESKMMAPHEKEEALVHGKSAKK